MTQRSRHEAYTWPYRRHDAYEAELRETAAAWFARHGYPVHRHYPYILARPADWPRNIILPAVADYVAQEQKARQARGVGFPLHKYLHHGLSSQAMLLNLVGPLILRADLAPLQAAFAAAGVPWPRGAVRAALEAENRAVFHEDYGQPTSLDLALVGDGGEGALYVEAKLVERAFGRCSVLEKGDCDGRNPARDPALCYLHHVGRTYWHQLRAHGCLDGPLGESPLCPLAGYYQFFRELLFAVHNNGSFVLLYDVRNPTFVSGAPGAERGLLPFLTSLVPPALQSRIGRVSIQAVLQAVVDSGRHADWAAEFAAKYGLDGGAA